MERREFITNCIERILNAPLVPEKRRHCAMDLAEAVERATQGGDEGEKAAHEYLLALCQEAQRGKYAG
jgi:hypothetical protein